jgi:pimeloyl-ACP methyl ester carboxylesterase
MRLHALTLPDGRSLTWSSWGAADGIPMLFIPGAGTGRLMTFGAAAAARAGICGWSIDRPGLGGSTLDPRRTLRSTADDLARLLDAHGIAQVAVVASSQGAPFALHLAASGRASSLDLVSPIDELAHPDVEPLLDDGRRSFVRRVRERPDEVEAELARYAADDLRAYVVGASAPIDREQYDREPLRTMLRDAMRDAFARGAAGYARDTVLATAAWDVDLDAVVTARGTRVWFGDLDVAHSPDLGRTLAHRLPASERRLVPGVGGALLWSHADTILDTIAGARPA